MNKKNILVTKASGISETYSPEKLRKSLAKSGADENLINDIMQQMDVKLYNGIPTENIYNEALKILRDHSRGFAGRYNLKKAIMNLGPSGFPFEHYIGALYGWMGYNVKLKQFLSGICITHEIDVLAENDRHVLLIECKYHNNQGMLSDVKVPLYINSRFRDILTMWEKTNQKKKLDGAIVTNTKFSSDAIKYGECAGLSLLAWNYPEAKSLSNLIDASKLYPLTCLNTLTNSEKERMLNAGIVLCSELKENNALLRQYLISETRIPIVLSEIVELLSY